MTVPSKKPVQKLRVASEAINTAYDTQSRYLPNVVRPFAREVRPRGDRAYPLFSRVRKGLGRLVGFGRFVDVRCTNQGAHVCPQGKRSSTAMFHACHAVHTRCLLSSSGWDECVFSSSEGSGAMSASAVMPRYALHIQIHTLRVSVFADPFATSP